jgi:hypothetical protein
MHAERLIFSVAALTSVRELRTLTYHDYRSYVVSAAAPAGKVYIKDASHPTSVTVNQEFSWYAVGEVRDGSAHNPGVAYYYKDGPAPSVKIVKKDGSAVDLPKGYAFVAYEKGDCPAGTLVDSRDVCRGAAYPAAGTYTIWLCSGVLSDDEAAMGVPSLGGMYELVTGHLAGFAGASLPVQATTVAVAVDAARRIGGPLALSALLMLLLR